MADASVQLVSSEPLRYLLSTPSERRPPGGIWPLLCFLHGHDEAAPLEIFDALSRHGPLRGGSPHAGVEQFIIVAPQLSSPGGDVWHRYAEAIRGIITQVRIAHGVDPLGQYLTGFSFGGNGVFDLAGLQPDLWAALWPVDPTRVPQADPKRPVWLSVGDVARYRKQEFIGALKLVDASLSTKGERLYLDQGQDHTGSATVAYRDDRIYTWLRSKRLSETS